MKKELIYQGENKERLDKYLVEAIHELAGYQSISRSQVQKLIKNGRVKVNGKNQAVHFFLHQGDCITIESINESVKLKPLPKEPETIFENNEYLVINKPVGLAVEGDPKEANLLDWLKEKKITKSQDEEFNSRSGIIHRLDKAVSGIMLVAKNPAFFHNLKEQFKKRQVKKIYLALVYGAIEQDEGKLNFVLARGRDGKMAARPENQEGKPALTEYNVLQRFKNYTFLEVRILTGRTHQIRVHFFAFNHPVVGDKLYFHKKNKSPLGLKRMFLHSHLIGFYDLDNNWQEYKIELPRDLKSVIKSLR